MFTFLVVLLVLVSILLIVSVLMQAGKGGGLAASFGGASTSADAFMGTRQMGNFLTKTSWWCGGIFLFLAFALQVMSTRASAPRSVLDQPATQAPAPGAPPTAGSATPVVPLEPTSSTPQPSKAPKP